MLDLEYFIEAHRSASSLIIDARVAGVGGYAEIDALVGAIGGKHKDEPIYSLRSLVLANKRVGFVRHAVANEATDMFRDCKIFLLISGRTHANGECLALALQQNDRATIIGETSSDGQLAPVGEGLGLFSSSVSRVLDISTTRCWESAGVDPHIMTRADSALNQAVLLAHSTPSKTSCARFTPY